MSNNDKFIIDTPFGKLMENQDTSLACPKCKYWEYNDCEILTNKICLDNNESYFLKEEVNHEDSITDFLTAKSKKHEISFPDIPKLKDIIQEYLKSQDGK